MKNILILGGTNFIGRRLVERLLESEAYALTLFNRQRTHAELFPQVNKIKGDRETESIEQIVEGNWDAVVDLSCYFPAALENTLKALTKESKYIFVSTCSVYDNEMDRSILKNETAPVLSCSAQQRSDRSAASYGNRKAECERLLMDSGMPYVILRPSLVFGTYDPTDPSPDDAAGSVTIRHAFGS